MKEYQKKRILVFLTPESDPLGSGYHVIQSKIAVGSGQLWGKGFLNGTQNQLGYLPTKYTDFIFSAIGEEMGYVGCFLVLIMLAAVIARCIWVGCQSPDYMRRMVCFGAAAALIFQVFVNVGMCIGLVPVIGLTLPLISYGGSSVVTIYAMLGLVSGVHARPAPTSHERYIRPLR
mgnify:CR=1 FL=1